MDGPSGTIVIDPEPLRGMLLAGWLAARHDLAPCSVCATLAEAKAAAAGRRPALVVISPEPPDGDGLRRLHVDLLPGATAILVDRSRSEAAVRRLPEGMNVAVIERGDPEGFTGALDRLVAESGVSSPAVLVEKRLSPRERDVMVLIGRGMQSTTIAEHLGMSRLTVETHRKSIARKLGVTGAGLVRRAALHLATSHRTAADARTQDGRSAAPGGSGR